MGEDVIMQRIEAPKTRGNALGVACALALFAGSALPAAAAIELAANEQGVVHVGSASSDEQRMRTLDVEMGKTVFFDTDFAVRRVSVGDPATLDVNVLSPRELSLVPKKIGTTNLVLWEASGAPALVVDVNVGSNYSPIEHRIESALGVSGVKVESAGESVVLTGTVPSPVHADRAVAVAKAFFTKKANDRVVNALTIGGNQQVMLEVVMAEMNRSLGRNMTFNYTTVIEHGGMIYGFDSMLGGLMSIDERALALSPATLGKSFLFGDRIDLTGTIINQDDFLLDMFIEAAQEKGLARVLAKPTLLARSGQAASFLAGGEVPIPIAQGGAFGSITIEFKEFGVGVQFAPTVLGSDRIYLEVSPEVSQPDYSIATISGGALIPGFVTRKASTSVELGDGQSFAIAGLLNDQVNSAIEKYPVFGDIPVLGALFRSVQFQRNETELVMIVTPRIVKPLPAGQIHLPTDAYVAPNDFELYMLGALESQREGAPQSTADAGSAGLIGPAGHRLPVSMEEENAQ
jgi:pilus assembly protein CpaC